jgi:hypothetical protein
MENENVRTVAAAVNRAGLVSINPPPFFIEECCPALWSAITALRSLRVNPACPKKRANMAKRLGIAARNLNWFAAVRRGGLPADQQAELYDIAKGLNSASAALSDHA